MWINSFVFQEANGTDGSCVFLDGQDSIISEYKWNQPAFQVMKTSDQPILQNYLFPIIVASL